MTLRRRTTVTLCLVAAFALANSATAAEGLFVPVSTVVVYSDHNVPLVAEITILAPDGHTTERLGKTKLPKGMLVLQPPFRCARGAQLVVSAPAGLFMAITVACDPNVVAELPSNTLVTALLRQSKDAQQRGDFGRAALAANGAATQLALVPSGNLTHTLAMLRKTPEPGTSPLIDALQNEVTARQHPSHRTARATITQEVYVNAGHFFDVPVAVDFIPGSSKPVPTPELHKAITDFQTDLALPATGQLDAPTLAEMAAVGNRTTAKASRGAAPPPEGFTGAAKPARAGCPPLIWRMASEPGGTVYGLAYYADLSGLSTIGGRADDGQFHLKLSKTEIGEGPAGSVQVDRTSAGALTVTLVGEGCATATLHLQPTANLNLPVNLPTNQ